jgi:two-component system nitrate/nitrite response regulator NarL
VGTQTPGRTGTGRSTPIRVLLVDDQPLFRRAIATLIQEQPEFTVVGEAADGREAIDQAHALNPDLIVMDVEMPVMNGVEAVRILRDQLPSIKIVVLTVSESEDYLLDAIRFGAHGYLLKDLRPEQLYEMLRAVMREVRELGAGSDRSVPASPAAEPTSQPQARPARPDIRTILTRRELETLQHVADGLSNKEIGTLLSITEGTVKNHVHNALEKLQLENRIQATAYVIREGVAHRPEGG